eukprot:1885367-Rhodomonas_salina.1
MRASAACQEPATTIDFSSRAWPEFLTVSANSAAPAWSPAWCSCRVFQSKTQHWLRVVKTYYGRACLQLLLPVWVLFCHILELMYRVLVFGPQEEIMRVAHPCQHFQKLKRVWTLICSHG